MTAAAELAEKLAYIESKLEELAARNVALERENKILREENALLKRGRFGRSSERIEPGQLGLFLVEPPAQEPVEKVKVPAYDRAKRGHGRAHFSEHLPRKVYDLDVPEEERVCACCGEPMRAIGEDVTERGHITPAQVVVHRYVCKKYACPAGHGIVAASAPEGIIPAAKYEASVYALQQEGSPSGQAKLRCGVYGTSIFPQLCAQFNCVSWAKVHDKYNDSNEVLVAAQKALNSMREEASA